MKKQQKRQSVHWYKGKRDEQQKKNEKMITKIQSNKIHKCKIYIYTKRLFFHFKVFHYRTRLFLETLMQDYNCEKQDFLLATTIVDRLCFLRIYNVQKIVLWKNYVMSIKKSASLFSKILSSIFFGQKIS